MFDLTKIKQSVKVEISEINITDHARERAGRFETPRSGKMFIVLQQGKGAMAIQLPRAVMQVGNGYFAILELFQNKATGEIVGKMLTTLTRAQLSVSLNMSFGNYFTTAIDFTVGEVYDLCDEELYLSLREWNHFLQEGILNGADLIKNGVEIEKAEVNNLTLSGYKMMTTSRNQIATRWYRIDREKTIVAA